MLNSQKTSYNQTGTLFYTKYSDQPTDRFRVRFKSFNLSFYQNKNKINQLDQMHTNYSLFKNGKCLLRRRMQSSSLMNRNGNNNDVQKFMNNKERIRQNQYLRQRLKSMKNQRKTLFQKLKSMKN